MLTTQLQNSAEAYVLANPTPLPKARIRTALRGAASLIAVIEISAKVASICFHYSVAVKDVKPDIDRLQRNVSDLKDVLEGGGY